MNNCFIQHPVVNLLMYSPICLHIPDVDGCFYLSIYTRVDFAHICMDKDVYSFCTLLKLGTTYSHRIKLLARSHQKYLWRILRIKWQFFMPDTTVLQQIDTSNIEKLFNHNQIKWTVQGILLEWEMANCLSSYFIVG